MGEGVPLLRSADACERQIAALLREAFPTGWIAHDIFVKEEQIDVLAVLPQGIFALECKAYSGRICGDPNSPWVAIKGSQAIKIEPRRRNPYRQALAKAFAVGDLLQERVDVDPHLSGAIRPWVHACVVFPEITDVSGFAALQVDPPMLLSPGDAKALVFHPRALVRYMENVSPELERETAAILVHALGGKGEGTWLEEPVIQKREEVRARRIALQIVWD